jgi:hypothetical protein
MPLSDLFFAVLVLGLAGGFVFGVWRAGDYLAPDTSKRLRWAAAALLMVAGWLALLAWAAQSGWTSNRDVIPPPTFRLMAFALLLVILVGLSPVGESIASAVPLHWLIGFQAFRLPLELLLDQFYREGRIPIHMTFGGRNFDIVTGLSAIFVAGYLRRRPVARPVALFWNLAGLALLFNIAGTAVLCLPSPWRSFDGPINALLFRWPTVWIVFCIQMALVGHILVFFKIRTAPPEGIAINAAAA